MLNTVKKCGRILDLFGKDRPELGVTEVARALRIPKTTAQQMLATLSSIGLLRRTADRRYRLGWKVLALSDALLKSTEVRVEARQVMEHLVGRYGETVHLAVLDNDDVVYVDRVQGTHSVQVALTWVGARLPGHCSAVGKVLLASRDSAEVAQIVERQGLTVYTERTIATLDDLEAQLAQANRDGFAYDEEESVPDLCCVAAPIRDFRGDVVAALSMSLPSFRFNRGRDQYREAIVRASGDISDRLGYVSRRSRLVANRSRG